MAFLGESILTFVIENKIDRRTGLILEIKESKLWDDRVVTLIIA